MAYNYESFVQMCSKEQVLEHFERLLRQQLLPKLEQQNHAKSFSLSDAEKCVDQLNAYPEPLSIASHQKAFNLTQWKQSLENRLAQEKSKSLLVQGKMIFWLLWAGEASRAEQALEKSDAYIYDSGGKALSQRPSKAFFHGNTIDSTLPSELNLAVRQMLQRRLDLEHLGGQDTLSKTSFIIHINEDNQQGVCTLFLRYHFFGFNPQNIIFVVQDSIEGFSFQNQELVPYGHKRPGGHGYTLLQLSWKNQGFWLDEKGTRHELVGISPLEYFAHAEFLCAFPIEDNVLLQSAFDLHRLAVVQTLFEENPHRILVLEAMLNKKKQKGGSFLQRNATSEGMMVEKLQLQTPQHEQLFQNPEQFPLLNRNITYIKIREFQEVMQQEGMFFTFNVKDPLQKESAGFWPDLVTCILTQSPKFMQSGIFYEEGLAIENFKTDADVPLLLQRFHEQMAQTGFQKLWKELKA